MLYRLIDRQSVEYFDGSSDLAIAVRVQTQHKHAYLPPAGVGCRVTSKAPKTIHASLQTESKSNT